METTARILQTALDLFNASGTAPVSTNHIAAAAELSPGNLYYHYHNKADIIAALAERMFAEWSGLWQRAQASNYTLENLQNSLRQNFRTVWKYRFFFREQAALLKRDAALKQRYVSIRRQRLVELQALLQAYAAAGLLRLPEDPDIFRRLISISMLINGQWLIEAEIEAGKVTPAQIEHGVELFLTLWRPYVGPAAESPNR